MNAARTFAEPQAQLNAWLALRLAAAPEGVGMGWHGGHEVFRRCHPVVHPRNGKQKAIAWRLQLGKCFRFIYQLSPAKRCFVSFKVDCVG